MGAAQAGGNPDDADDPADENTHDPEAFDRLLRGDVDAKEKLRGVFGNDVAAQEELDRIVQELEGQTGDATVVSKERKKLEAMAKEAEKRERRTREAEARTAQEQAGNWFERQLNIGRAAEAAAKVEKDRIARERAVQEKAEALQRAKVAERDLARDEAAARAALWEDAANAKISSGVMSGMNVPMRPPEPEGEAEPPQAPAPDMNSIIANAVVPEFYKLLKVSVDATFDEIKKGYRKQALLWHPDKNRHRMDAATERFKKINEAFDTLYDPKKKEAYDSGKILSRKAKRLAGHGWSGYADEADETLTPQGLKYKKQSWRGYVLMYGRIDDDPEQLVQDDRDPRAPQVKIQIFWRFMGEMVYEEREKGEDENWCRIFIARVWKDTPDKWPKALELQTMGETAQQEWKERRMVFNRRKQKLLIHLELHEDYLAIPDREELEVERLRKKRGGFMQRMEGVMSTDPTRVG